MLKNYRLKHYFIIFFLVFISFFILDFISATNCWQYTSIGSGCTSANGCRWRNDSWSSNGWCEELSCWSLYSQSECTTTNVPGKNCTWQVGLTSYGCEKLNCWSFSGTSNNSCTNNSLNLNCQWSDYCYTDTWVSGVDCWSKANQSSCVNTTGCKWGQCNERGCWTYSNSSNECRSAKDPWNGRNCTWITSLSDAGGYCSSDGCWRYNNQTACLAASSSVNGLNCEWTSWNSCNEIDCYSWSDDNAATCVNNSINISCIWESYSWGGSCMKKDCWNYRTNQTCAAHPECNWKTYKNPDYCQEVQCYNWDGWSGGTESSCLGNSTKYNLNCVWQNFSYNSTSYNSTGYCYKNIALESCANKTTERTCLDTFYCWWQYNNINNASAGGNCSEPGVANWGSNATNATTIIQDWNPKCYIFDMNITDCNNTIGCVYNSTSSRCIENANSFGGNITLNGLNCSFINESKLCNNIPILSSCCAWSNSTCIPNKLDSNCKTQIQQRSKVSCEDAKKPAECEEIAGSPLYMPCQWENSTSKCLCKALSIFGNDTQSLMLIENKITCESCGGKWIIENYCEGTISLPLGRCESKFNDEDNCDKACFACENKNSNKETINASNAKTACDGSALGYCEFVADTTAPNGIGFCRAKEQFKKGVAGDCNINCGDCTFKGDPNSNESSDKRPKNICNKRALDANGNGCKWIDDNSTSTGGYCINGNEKVCEDSCDRCKTTDDCSNKGRTALSNKTGSCIWQGTTSGTTSGTSSTGSCVANTGEDVEICWNGEDDNSNNLVDCADTACYSEPDCGFVSGDCFKYNTSAKCVLNNATCEWVIDNWGSWCDFKGSQCWRYGTNSSSCNGQTNCLWNNGTSGTTGWCERDWSKQNLCMGKNRTSCITTAINASTNCEWSNDTWCSSNGATTDWCLTSGGWCDHPDFKPKNCWTYNTGSSQCNSHSGCSWHKDTWSTSTCEINQSANCWNYSTSATCSNTTATGGMCLWRSETWGNYTSNWCDSIMSACWSSYNQTACNSYGTRCRWKNESWGGYCEVACYSKTNSSSCLSVSGCNWKEESGWCEEEAMASCTNSSNNNEGNCGLTAGCRWKNPGWCDPKSGFTTASSTSSGGGGTGTAVGGDCYRYDNNRTLCTNKTAINISCGWSINNNPKCEVDWSRECWKYNSTTGCNSTNGCWWNPGSGYGGWCSNLLDQCWSNASYQSWNNTNWAESCNSNYLCQNNSWSSCEPRCFSLTQTECTNSTYTQKCRWVSGWCNPSSMTNMFDQMQGGAPAPLGVDSCNEGIQASVDMCGFGMKDMDDSYGFAAGVSDFSNSSVCNKETLSSFVMAIAGGGAAGGMVGGGPGGSSATEKTGSGNETVVFFVYLDSDGSTTGSCNLDYNTSALGYEFKFKYTSVWNASTSKAIETFNAYECDNSQWKATNIKLSAWKKKMCSEIGGPMIAIKKADLLKYPTLYSSTSDIRVFVATYFNITNGTLNLSSPADTVGPGWTTPGSIDFEIFNAFDFGADTTKFEDILKKGFVQGEDCFNTIDDDNDGNSDCNDWDCQYSERCAGIGVNAPGYVDSSTPLVTGVKIEEYLDAVLIMYDTNKPANGTLEWYGADSTCSNATGEPGKYIFPDVGIVKNNTVRQYKLWHVAAIYNGATKMNSSGFNTYPAPVVPGFNSYYKLKVCDANNKCAISKCSSFKLPTLISKCSYCNFVTRIQAPAGWNVSYDLDQDGTYEHLQGQMCGPNAGMKTNYTDGRKADIKLIKSDGTSYIEFINVTLTKTGLNDKVRTISTSGDIISASNLIGMTSETRDKIINNLHPELCRVKIPAASGSACNRLYHCDDSGANCVDKTAAAGGAPIDATNCIWNVPFCEFSTYKTSGTSGGTPPPGGGGGGGGGTMAATYTLTETQLASGYTQSLAANDKFKFTIANAVHYASVESVSSTTIKVNVSSTPQKATLAVGDVKKFDVDADGKYYDISLKLNDINKVSYKANLTIKAINEAITAGGTGAGTAGETGAAGEERAETGEVEKAKVSATTIWIIIIAVIVIIALLIWYFMRKKINIILFLNMKVKR